MTRSRVFFVWFLAAVVLAGGTGWAAELGQKVYVAPFTAAAADCGAYATKVMESSLGAAGFSLVGEGEADFVVKGELPRVATEPRVFLYSRSPAVAFAHLKIEGADREGAVLFEEEASASGYDVSFPWAKGTKARKTAIEKCIKTVVAGLRPGVFVKPPEPILYPLSKGEGKKVVVVAFEGPAADCNATATASARKDLEAAGFEAVQNQNEADLVLSGEILGLFTEPPVRLGSRSLATAFALIRFTVRDSKGDLLFVTSASDTGFDRPFWLAGTPYRAFGKKARKTAIEKCAKEAVRQIAEAAG